MPLIDHGLPDIPTPSDDELNAWDEWATSRPDIVRKMCEKLPPWHYYFMPKTGQIVTVEGYSEDGTIRVGVVGDRISIPAILQLQVFGVSPNDLIVYSGTT